MSSGKLNLTQLSLLKSTDMYKPCVLISVDVRHHVTLSTVLLIVVDVSGDHMPSSRSFDTSTCTRPDILSLDTSIPEESAVEIADTSYAPAVSPDEPPRLHHPAEDISAESADDSHAVTADTDVAQLGNSSDVPSLSNKPTRSRSRLWSVIVALAVVLLSTLVGLVVMFEFSGSAALHALPTVNRCRRKLRRRLHAAVSHGLDS